MLCRGWHVLLLFVLGCFEQPGGADAGTPRDVDRGAEAPDAPLPDAPLPASPDALPAGLDARVTRVVDGDTVEVAVQGRRERVRYIGIDTPETGGDRGPEPLGREATVANRALVDGQRVRLVLDVEERDRFGRLLAYVFRMDGTFVNGTLIEEGLARILTIPPNVRYARQLRELEARARSEGRGLWSR